MPEIYDVIIIGGGPAGLSAGIYACRARLGALIIEKGRAGGQAATTVEMENYPGSFGELTGPALMDRFAKHAERFGAGFVKGQVTGLDISNAVKIVELKNGETYRGRSIILSPGAEPRTLGIQGERSFRGKGVSYCATCDADFFEDLDIAVIGNGDAAIEEALYLTKFANEVTVVALHDEGVLDCNKASAEKAFENEKMKWIWNSSVVEIAGDEIVEKIIVKNIKTGALSEKEVNGVFFFVGTIPLTGFLKGKVELDANGYILTNDLMETNVPGVYAAGDARAKYLRQVVTAASDGAVAAVAAEKYLAETEFIQKNVLDSSVPVLLAFWAPQIPESVEALKTLEDAVAAAGDKVKLCKVDTYRNKKTAEAYGVTAIPSAILVAGGAPVGRLDGSVAPDGVKALISGIV